MGSGVYSAKNSDNFYTLSIIGNVECKKPNNLTEPNLTLMSEDLELFWGGGIQILFRFIWDVFVVFDISDSAYLQFMIWQQSSFILPSPQRLVNGLCDTRPTAD